MIITLNNSTVRQRAGGVLRELIEMALFKHDSRCDNLHPFSFFNSRGSVEGRQNGMKKENISYSCVLCGSLVSHRRG